MPWGLTLLGRARREAPAQDGEASPYLRRGFQRCLAYEVNPQQINRACSVFDWRATRPCEFLAGPAKAAECLGG